MNWLNVLYVVLTLAVIVISMGIIMFFLRLSKTLSNVNVLIEDIHKEIMPIILSLQITVDKTNESLSAFDEVARSVRDISNKFNVVVRVLQEAMSSPLIKLAGVSAGAKKILNTLVKGENR
ncbi:MAG TPA: hypothetical protein ENN38_00895 [Actinobacteria bacterium]|nr:hypothetical protein [Actinomycetota bacterium]